MHYEECLNLKVLYPTVYDAFTEGDFKVHYTYRKDSAASVDQALEKPYNKPAKGPGRVIGITRKKNL